MFIKPTVAIDNGWIKGNFTEDSIQPNALDFTLDKLFTIDQHAIFKIDEESKTMRGGYEVKPERDAILDKDYWCLSPNTSYDGMSDFYVEVPEGVAAMLIVRSTFNRNGIFITSGLYDQGFSGNIGYAIHNNSGIAFIAPHTRIGQIIFVESESAGELYKGQYNTQEGQHYSEVINNT